MMMNNGLDFKHFIDPLNLKKSQYFVSLVNEAISGGMISEDDSLEIESKVTMLLQERCYVMGQKGHSSVSSDVAEGILREIVYNVSLALKAAPYPEAAVMMLLEKNMSEIYSMGVERGKSLITEARGNWAVITKKLLSTSNECFNDTVTEEIKTGFASLQKSERFDESIFLSYPLYIEERELRGVEYFLDYLKKLNAENSFCINFSEVKIANVLSCLDMTYRGENNDMVFNIFEYIFANAIACMLLRKSPFDLEISAQEKIALENGFMNKGEEEIAVLLKAAAKALYENLQLNEETGIYLERSAEKLASKISGAVNFNDVFLSPREIAG